MVFQNPSKLFPSVGIPNGKVGFGSMFNLRCVWSRIYISLGVALVCHSVRPRSFCKHSPPTHPTDGNTAWGFPLPCQLQHASHGSACHSGSKHISEYLWTMLRRIREKALITLWSNRSPQLEIEASLLKTWAKTATAFMWYNCWDYHDISLPILFDLGLWY